MAGLTENIVVSPLRAVVEVKCRTADVVNSMNASATSGFVGNLLNCKSPSQDVVNVERSSGCSQRSPLAPAGAVGAKDNSRGSSSSGGGGGGSECPRIGGIGGGVDENDGVYEDGRRSSAERRKKPRRRKTKRKNPYSKIMTESRGKKNMRLREGGKVYEQPPEAPYNSNQFLIEDHNDIEDLDKKLKAASADVAMDITSDGSVPPSRGSACVTGSGSGPAVTGLGGVGGVGGQRARVRDASFTSAESDEDFFYSSPEDEEEFLQKEFSNTYQDLHVESLAMMSKPELIQTILQLEEKMDYMQKKMDGALGKSSSATTGASAVSVAALPSESSQSNDSSRVNFQTGISRLALGNGQTDTGGSGGGPPGASTRSAASSSPSSEDSESDSSSSSDTSVSTEGGRGSQDALTHRQLNGHVTEISDMATDNT